MKIAILFTLLAAVVVLSAAAAMPDPPDDKVERDGNATQVAKAWFASLMKGETAVTASLSDIPFAFDKKLEVKTYSDLKQLYDQVVANKGKRDLKLTSVKIESSSPEKVEVVLMIEDEGIVVVIKPGEAFRVVGFAD